MNINIHQMLAGRASQFDATATQKKSGPESSGQSNTATVTGDSVSLTSEALKLAQISKQPDTATTVNEAKIARLREAIAGGDYQIDPARLARNISDFESQLHVALDDE